MARGGRGHKPGRASLSSTLTRRRDPRHSREPGGLWNRLEDAPEVGRQRARPEPARRSPRREEGSRRRRVSRGGRGGSGAALLPARLPSPRLNRVRSSRRRHAAARPPRPPPRAPGTALSPHLLPG